MMGGASGWHAGALCPAAVLPWGSELGVDYQAEDRRALALRLLFAMVGVSTLAAGDGIRQAGIRKEDHKKT